MAIIKPKKLRKGDTVAVLSPSSGAAHRVPHVFESGLETLRNLGLKIKEYPSARKEGSYLYAHPELEHRILTMLLQILKQRRFLPA
jgi:muramoyltetrapeptide carboxypeptidase LdcA involved in peptidoglycan recycling